MNETKKLYLSNKDKKICGVCGGLAEYFNTDSTLIRLGAIVIGLVTGILPIIIGYFLAAMVMPEKKDKD